MKPTQDPEITHELMQMIFEASKDTYPNEFGALLKKAKDGIIDELLLLPGTQSGRSSALFRLHMLPITYDVVGSIHSHPSPHPFPSKADINFFSRLGDVHIIVAHPFDMGSWRGYNRQGEPLKIEVLKPREY